MQSLIEKLRSRGVFKTVSYYLGLSWLLIGAGDVFFPMLGFSESYLKSTVILVVIGLPVVFVGTWLLNAPGAEEGSQATKQSGIDILTTALLAVVFLTSAVFVYLEEPPETEETAQEASGLDIAEASMPRIAILPVEDFTVANLLPGLKEIVPELIAAQFLPHPVSTVIVDQQDSALGTKDIGLKHNARYLLSLRLLETEDQISLSSRFTDAASGQVLGIKKTDAPRANPSSLTTPYAIEELQLLETFVEAEKARVKTTPPDKRTPWDILWDMPDGDWRAFLSRGEEVVSEHPNFYVAKAMLSRRYWLIVLGMNDLEGDAARALELAQEAYDQAPDNILCINSIMAAERSFGDKVLSTGYAEKLLRNYRIFDLVDPYLYLIADDKVQTAIDHMDKNPLASEYPKAMALAALGDYTQAETAVRRALLEPSEGGLKARLYFLLADILGHQGRIEEGRAILSRYPPKALAVLVKSNQIYWGDDHTHMKYMRGIEKLGYTVPEVEYVRKGS